jgi:hypothetical protein
MFSAGGTPLVPAAVPMQPQLQLEGALRNVSNDTNVPVVIRVAVMDKYIDHSSNID